MYGVTTIRVRDNDGAYGRTFRRRLYAMGIRDKPTMPRSPWQNGYVERVIGSIRRECVNHILIANAAHLRRVLNSYTDYYNSDRTHLGIGKDSPNPRTVEASGALVSRSVLGGLHHRYGRASAMRFSEGTGAIVLRSILGGLHHRYERKLLD